MARRGRRARRTGGLDLVERGGHALLTRAWSMLVWAVDETLGRLVTAWSWFRRRPPAVRVLVLSALAVAAAVVAVAVVMTGAPARVAVVDDVEALARVIRSEVGTGTAQQRIHVAWATRNLAVSRGQGVAEMACAPCGEQALGRPVSSRQAATDADRALARAVLAAPALLDPTGGACHFLDPALQDALAAAGRDGYRGRSYARVRRQWIESYGWEPYYRLGPDLELWGRRRSR